VDSDVSDSDSSELESASVDDEARSSSSLEDDVGDVR